MVNTSNVLKYIAIATILLKDTNVVVLKVFLLMFQVAAKPRR